ncbi:MAG: glycerophosphodiester phosphodiesterase [Clostridia bacterium]|nr:glycerophosphodiester phosphodiesterase [Clostridia bacterium]
MKKLLKVVSGVLCASAVAGAVCKMVTLDSIRDLVSDAEAFPNGFTYTAHTGCVETPDNSLQSIEVGVKYGADIVEFDVRHHNGDIILSHDAPVGGEVTLEQAFLKVKEYDGLQVNVDVKSTEELHLVQEIAIKTGMLDRIFFTGIFEKDTEIVKKECPEIAYYLNMDVLPKKEHTAEYLQSLVDTVKGCGAVGINFNKDNASKELVQAFRDAGLKVSIWTVSKEHEIYKILSYCPDNITTRRPDRVQRIIGGVEKVVPQT